MCLLAKAFAATIATPIARFFSSFIITIIAVSFSFAFVAGLFLNYYSRLICQFVIIIIIIIIGDGYSLLLAFASARTCNTPLATLIQICAVELVLLGCRLSEPNCRRKCSASCRGRRTCQCGFRISQTARFGCARAKRACKWQFAAAPLRLAATMAVGSLSLSANSAAKRSETTTTKQAQTTITTKTTTSPIKPVSQADVSYFTWHYIIIIINAAVSLSLLLLMVFFRKTHV